MATKKTKNVASGGWPKITQGSHLTVTTYEDGRTELKWDDEALMRDVQNAIASLDTLVAVTEEKVKKTRKKQAV
jgi:hypothetical protein